MFSCAILSTDSNQQQSMGGCVPVDGKKQKQAKSATNIPLTKFSSEELEMLKLMYQNLAIRCRGRIVSREVFEVFFHSSGLIGELLFTKFDQKNSGYIKFEDFSKAFSLMVKGSFHEKAEVLFELYDIDKSGGVKYSELLKILFSYPTEDLNKMLVQDDFLNFLGEGQLGFYFGPEHKEQQSSKLHTKIIVEEDSQDSNDFPLRKGSVYAPTSDEFMQIQSKIRAVVEQDRKKKKTDLPDIFKKNSQLEVPDKAINKKIGSNAHFTMKKNRKNLQVKTNISSLTKKYVAYLFKSFNLDKENQKFTKDHFKTLLENHPSIFKIYLSGFHTYIWQHTDGKPDFMDITSWIEGKSKMVYTDETKNVYLKFVRTTIFVLENPKYLPPIEIINLEGLTVERVESEHGFGIKFKHRDGLYTEKEYYLESKLTQEEWMSFLCQFKENSIFDEYIKLERIGGGNFSNVFRGKEKKTDKQVAIKIIQNFKLSQSERQVIKRECGILKLCHHQNIVKFIHEYKTNTHLYIVTELLSQGDLFEYTKKNMFLQEYEAAIIFRQIVDAINYLNELGIIHRDLKPENVMIILNQQKKMVKKVKLIDFGFGVYQDKLKDLPLKQKFAGTPGFIAPEVYKCQEYDEKIDTFSLGIILYFMLSGYLPFQSNYIEEIEQMTKNCNINLQNMHWSNVSKEARDLIYKILTFKQNRITTKQVYNHPWLQKIEELKTLQGINRKNNRLI